MIKRLCFESESSPNPLTVSARCEVICLIGSGPCAVSRAANFSGVTAAAAARASGEFVLSGPVLPPVLVVGKDAGLYDSLLETAVAEAENLDSTAGRFCWGVTGTSFWSLYEGGGLGTAAVAAAEAVAAVV